MLSEHMTAGDDIYQQIVIENEHRGGLAVEEDDYPKILHMNVIKHDFIMYISAFSIEFYDNTLYVGSVSDSSNDVELAHTLESILNTMFNIDHHKAGVLIAEGYSYGVIRNADKYYFTDSHSCGVVGDQEAATQEIVKLEPSQAEAVPLIQTSVRAPIDCAEPNVEDKIEISNNGKEIRLKTKDSIVNEAHELKAEEYACYFLFPYGKNGLREQRYVPITPLDYFQYRILGSDTRFQ
ncbi:uncharacterized protein NPIL_464071 [Nephila pilipes]|uniref:Uncharacterized protein n=1 Tax=Nephila pilipes TaxID=299642 RepID=A0A8X6QPB3_NEPPI|nr:uncharacterized protein NPIL_464071 [Nephila pilipes]